MKELLPNKIVSRKTLLKPDRHMRMPVSAMKPLPRTIRPKGQAVTFSHQRIRENLLVKEGDYVTVGQPLVSITQNRRLFLRADVSEKYYPYLRTIGSANFCTPYNNKVYTLKGPERPPALLRKGIGRQRLLCARHF